MTFFRKFFILFGIMLPLLKAQQVDSTGIKLITDRKYADAQLFFEKAVDTDSKNAEAYYFLSQSLLMQQKNDEAEDAIDEAIDLQENISKYHLLRGQILGVQAMNANIISQGFLAPKIKNAFLRASELDPSNIEARQALYNYYVMAPGIMGGSQEKAYEQASAVVRLNPYRGLMMLANYSLRVKKDTADAENHLKKAIDAEPKKGGGYKQLGYFYMNRGKFIDAYDQMQKFIELEPKNPDAHDSYADVLKAERKYSQAIEKYRYALSLDKSFSASIFSMAECFELQGNKQKAKETYQWFLSVESKGRRAEAAQKKINEL